MVRHVDHHLAHAASVFYASGFDESMIITADLTGEE
jgi:predicted NodU family carbamoyl transferase